MENNFTRPVRNEISNGVENPSSATSFVKTSEVKEAMAGKEHKILEFWEKIGLLGKLREKNKKTGKGPWSFLDGPITANNPMGVHHAWGRTYKDMFERYKAMQGYKTRFQNGFDCQGLWVEVEVEKELGFKNKKDIEEYGIEKFVNKCKERVHKYSKIQTEQSIRLGMLKDWGEWQTEFDEKGDWLEKSHSYYTMSDENNYAIWHFLKKCKEQGLLYKGRDVVPWCPRCGTAISQHEILTEEYKEITHKAVYVRFPVVDHQNTYFLVWTTTPWTLPGNVALAVHPDLEYAMVKSQEEEIYILLKEKVELINGGQVLKTFKGKDIEEILRGGIYVGIFDELMGVKQAVGDHLYCVVLWQDVNADEGTGIVHIAPGCGAEDFQLAKNEEFFPVIDLTDNESNYRRGFGELAGKFVGSEQVRQWIFDNLESKGLVYRIEDYKHRYPTCWRCKTELIFRLVDEWYIAMAKPLKSKIKNQNAKIQTENQKEKESLREQLLEAAKQINWIPGFCLERELDWLKNMQDWLISKKRYWGLALPIWECECGNFEVIGSREELKDKAVEGWEDFIGHSPHRPWIDAVKIKCSKCGFLISRILDVGNPWLDAGIVPFSTISDDNRSDNIPYFQNSKEGKAEWQKWFPVDLVCESFPGQFKNWFYVLLVMSQVLEGKPPFKNLLGFASVVDEKGEEMHKSKGNAIWFDDAVEKIGADAMRWMYATQNPASNLRFGYNVARETERKILILTNCFKFFETYGNISNLKSQISNLNLKFKNLLDKWIISRLNNIIKQATESLEKFDSMRASQAIEDFWINDLSLWYVRRSRKRFQNPESQEDKQQAEQTFHYVLLTICKLIAPTMPFLAEEIYQKLKIEKDSESVHLCEWPEPESKFIDEKLEKEMAEIRKIASLGLAKRAEVGIGVRQALSQLRIKNYELRMKGKEELLGLIKDEVNVKEIIFDREISEDIELDTKISEELKEEGQVREIIRQIQDLRKKAGLVPQDKVWLYFASLNSNLENILLKNKNLILETARLIEVKNEPGEKGSFLKEKEVAIDGGFLWLALSK